MYHDYFGLREEPFGVTPDRRFFFQTAQHREAVATLFYAIEQRRGFALLLGGAGLGKTSILFTLVQMLKGQAQIAFLANPYYDRDTVLDSILASFGLEPAATPAASHRLFYNFLLKAHNAGKTVVVIFDEAQDLSRDTLEAIRMLSNFETPDGKLVQIVVAGQPRLAETLKQPDCEQIRQRFNAIARLEPLTASDIQDYMAYRLETAGGSVGLFTPAAIGMVASASGGVPRNVNTICFNSLTLAYALEQRHVGVDQVSEALRDLDLPAAGAPAKQPDLDARLQAVIDRQAALSAREANAPANPAAGQPRLPESATGQPLAFVQAPRSFRATLIAAGLTLMLVCTILLIRF